jgi:hypothetical protein
MDIRNFSFGGAAAVVTSMSLIIGLGAASASRATIVGGLLIVAIADNLTDSLSMHMYQESERLDARKAFRATLSNFATRLCLSLSFIFLMIVLPLRIALIASSVWGLALLTGLTYVVARDRGHPVIPELVKHIAAAVAVLLASMAIGRLIGLQT